MIKWYMTFTSPIMNIHFHYFTLLHSIPGQDTLYTYTVWTLNKYTLKGVEWKYIWLLLHQPWTFIFIIKLCSTPFLDRTLYIYTLFELLINIRWRKGAKMIYCLRYIPFTSPNHEHSFSLLNFVALHSWTEHFLYIHTMLEYSLKKWSESIYIIKW